MRRTVYTATDFPVDLDRPPDPSAVPGSALAFGGTFVTAIDISRPQAFAQHCQQNVPPSPNRPLGTWPRFITAVEVPDQGLRPDPHGPPPTYWVPPGTPGTVITRS